MWRVSTLWVSVALLDERVSGLTPPGRAEAHTLAASRQPSSTEAFYSSEEASAAETAWTALGEHWWYVFVDGWAHAGGEYVFQDTKDSNHTGQTGDFIGLVSTQYALVLVHDLLLPPPLLRR